jgi:thioredoxin-like negative regulator of GroEL
MNTRARGTLAHVLCATLPLLVLSGCPSAVNRRDAAPDAAAGRTAAGVTGSGLSKAASGGGTPAAGKDGTARAADPLDVAGAVLPQTVERDGGFARLTYAQAVKLAQRDDRTLFLYLFTRWCGPCKELDARVFPTQEFQAFASSIVSIKVDAMEPEGQPVAKRYRVDSYPTMIVCKPDGTEIERFFGFSEAPEFIATIRNYIEGRNTASWFMQEAHRNPSDMALAFTAGEALAIRERGSEAVPFLKAVIADPGPDPQSNKPRAMLLLARTVYLDQMKDHAGAVPVLEDLSRLYPDTYFGVEATYDIARIYVEQRQPDKARDVLVNRITLTGKDPIEHYRFASFCLMHSFMLPEAAAVLDEGIKARPDAAFLWKTLADVRFRQQQYDSAVEAMAKAVELEPATEAYVSLLATYRNVAEKMKENK